MAPHVLTTPNLFTARYYDLQYLMFLAHLSENNDRNKAHITVHGSDQGRFLHATMDTGTHTAAGGHTQRGTMLYHE